MQAMKQKMKDSDIEWIGKIPQDWGISRLKFLTSYVSRGESPEYAEHESLTKVVNQACIYWDGLRLENVKQDVRRFVFGNKGKLESGDLLMNSTGTGTLGRLAHFDLVGDYIADSHVTIIRTKRLQLHPVFLKYLFSINLFQGYIYATAVSGSTNQIELSREKLKTVPILLPPIDIQAAQVEFLDTQTSIIDHTIEQKRKLINLLKEKRTAIINRAVTRGLEENVELVDSGVEWIGKVPKGWRVERLKSVANINRDVLSEDTPPDYVINYLDIGDVESNGVSSVPTEYTFANAPSRARRMVHDGTVILATVRTYLKAISYIEKPVENLIVSTGFATLDADQKVLSKYLYYLTSSELFIQNVVRYSTGVSYPAIAPTVLDGLPVLYPSVEIQRQIITYLDKKRITIDLAVAQIQKSIQLLTEYRTSLTSHVVTGKVEV